MHTVLSHLAYFHMYICGIINALDEGSFLWAQRRDENVNEDKKWVASAVKPGRWTRSVFNWLHSPLINSIQEAFVADSIYENSPPVTKCVKRSIRKNASHVNLEESFENEFFLWEDNEGNPLEFGLKQIQDVMPHNQPVQQDYRRFNRGQADNLWEEPLVYEYNQDARDVDINHLSYHEKYKLNDILKNKLHNAFNHVLPFKHHRNISTKRPSLYYTLSSLNSFRSPTNYTRSSSFLEDSSNQEYFKQNLNTEYENSPTTLSRDAIGNKLKQSEWTEQKSWTEVAEMSSQFAFENDLKKQSKFYVLSPAVDNRKLTTVTTPGSTTKNLTSILDTNFLLKNPKDVFSPLKPWLDFQKANIGEEETSYIQKGNLNDQGLMKSYDIQKNVSNEAPNHRRLRTVHHKRFLKYKRKNKRKNNKMKYPEGHSYQYELFNGNFKSSDK